MPPTYDSIFKIIDKISFLQAALVSNVTELVQPTPFKRSRPRFGLTFLDRVQKVNTFFVVYVLNETTEDARTWEIQHEQAGTLRKWVGLPSGSHDLTGRDRGVHCTKYSHNLGNVFT